MRLRCFSVFFVLILFGSSAAWGQQPVSVDPYEVLYGKRLTLPRREPSPESLKPSAQAVALVQARSDALIARVGTLSASIGPSAPKQSIRDLSDALRKGNVLLQSMRDEGKMFATWLKASQLLLFCEVTLGFMEALVKEAMQDASGGQGSLSRIPELRAKLNAFHARILLAKPTSPGAVLAILEAQGDWVDMTTLLDLVQNQPTALQTLIEPLQPDVTPQNRERLIRLAVEPILAPVMQWWLDEADLLLQVSQGDTVTQPLRIEERALRELARAYGEAAAANLKLLELRAQGRILPKRESDDEVLSRVAYFLLAQRIGYTQSHRDEPGVDAALTLLGASFSAYRSSLSLHALFEIATAPVLWGDEARDTPEKARAATRNGLLAEEGLHARQGAALTRNAISSIPSPIVLAVQTGTELSDGTVGDRELALDEFIDAAAMAQLTVALTPLPGSASRGAGGLLPGIDKEQQDAAVAACIEQLENRQTGILAKATGRAFNKNWLIKGDDLRELVRTAIFETCTRARFLNKDMEPYFWKVYQNAYVDWWREVVVRARAAPLLTQTCVNDPAEAEEELLQEACSLRSRAMEKLSADERQLILWRFKEGLADRDIGDRLGIPEATASKRLWRITTRLREIYQELAKEREAISAYLPRAPDVRPKPALSHLDAHVHAAFFRRENAAIQLF